MITMFSSPKPFRSDINTIQRNAIKSWTLLTPTPEIILMGNEEGTAKISKEFGIQHIADVKKNEFGTPLVNDLFAKAEKAARNPLMCYVNTDIILMSDFLPSIHMTYREQPGSLIVGRRWDLDVSEPLDFSNRRSSHQIFLQDPIPYLKYIRVAYMLYLYLQTPRIFFFPLQYP